MESVTRSIALKEVLPLFPGLENRLEPINDALRNINRGKMDYLPYEMVIEGYQLFMRAELIPQGSTRPPAMGHWQIEIVPAHESHRLLLQGKIRGTEHMAELVEWVQESAEDPAPQESP